MGSWGKKEGGRWGGGKAVREVEERGAREGEGGGRGGERGAREGEGGERGGERGAREGGRGEGGGEGMGRGRRGRGYGKWEEGRRIKYSGKHGVQKNLTVIWTLL